MKKLTFDEMKAIANKKGGLCLSRSYEGSKTKLRWRCAKGHEWEAVPSAIKLGRWCKKCAVEVIAARRRISLVEIQEMAKSRGGQLISSEYIGNKDDKLRWRCSEGHEWEATLGKVRNDGSWCPTCARVKHSLTLEEMKTLAHAKGGECLSDIYRGQRVKLRWRCAKGHEWEAAPGHIRNQGCWCPKCSGRAPIEIEEMREIARSRGGKCLSGSLINALSKLRWRCSEGHEFEARPNDVKSGHWCRKCGAESRAVRRRTPLDEIQALARLKGGKCLSEKYENSKVLLQWQCARGHEWKASLRNVKNNKSWCPICGAGVSERICRGIFEALFQTLFPKVRPNWLRNERGNWMELDGYSKELGIAFEYHGIQHYEFNPFFHDKKSSFAQRQKDDQQRAEFCRAQGICLLEIPYTIQHKDIESFVRKASKEMGIHIPNQDPVNLENLSVYDDDPLEEIKVLAQTKGGQCLSTIYINKDTKIRWRCAEGHEWEMPAHAVRNSGQWCPRCGIKRRSNAQRLNINDMHALAHSRGGLFVADRYEGVNKKHRWRCAEGHEWEAKPNNVKHGSWCPICARVKRHASR